MTLKMLIATTAKFMLRVIAYYFATLLVLALLFPEVDKYQILLFAWVSGVLVALYGQRLSLQQN